MALKRLPYAADIAVCLPRRSTFKLRGIVKNIHQLGAANPLSLECQYFSRLCCDDSAEEKVLCVFVSYIIIIIAKKKRGENSAFFLAIIAFYAFGLMLIAALLLEWPPQTDKHKKPLNTVDSDELRG